MDQDFGSFFPARVGLGLGSARPNPHFYGSSPTPISRLRIGPGPSYARTRQLAISHPKLTARTNSQLKGWLASQNIVVFLSVEFELSLIRAHVRKNFLKHKCTCTSFNLHDSSPNLTPDLPTQRLQCPLL